MENNYSSLFIIFYFLGDPVLECEHVRQALHTSYLVLNSEFIDSDILEPYSVFLRGDFCITV